MKDDQVESRLKKLEWKLNVLIGVAIVQAVLMTIIAVGFLVPSTFTIIAFCALLILFAVAFHKQIPLWFGNFSRYVFSQILNSPKPNSVKDLK